MATTPPQPTSTSGEAAKSAATLQPQVATATAARLGVPSTSPPKITPSKGGRKTAAQEAMDYLAAKGLVAVRPGEHPAPVDLLDRPPIDPALVKDTTRSLLESYSQIRCEWTAGEAAKAGFSKSEQGQLADLARIKPGNAAVMIETSPLVVQSLGIDGNNYPLAAFLTALAVDSAQFLAAIRALRRMAAEAAERAAATPTPNPSQS